MVGRDGAFGILMGAAVGMFFLVPAHGLAQDSLSVSCADVNVRSPLSDVLLCALREQAFAQHILGLWYDTGDYGLTEDDEEAVRWYRRAADKGYAGAQSALGFLYAHGEGVPEDDIEAVRWYRFAAEQGWVNAQYNLGLMYADGEGVPEDWSCPDLVDTRSLEERKESTWRGRDRRTRRSSGVRLSSWCEQGGRLRS